MRRTWTEFPLISHLDRVLAPRWSYSHKEIGRDILFWTRIIFIGRVELLRVCEVKSDTDLMDEHIIALLGRLELILSASHRITPPRWRWCGSRFVPIPDQYRSKTSTVTDRFSSNLIDRTVQFLT